MKKISTLLLLFMSILLLQAQGSMSVESFKALPNDLDAVDAQYEKKDFNGETAAIIKVVTQEKNFTFDVGAMGIVATVQHVGEVWVYVPHSIQRISIKHPSLGVLRDYYMPIQIEKARVYELVLHSGNITQVVHQDAGGQYVILDITPKVAGVSIAGAETEYITDGYYEKFLPYGEHSISVSSSMYKNYEGVINVSGEKVEQTINLQPNFGSLHIDANVSGAEVYIDDVPKGKTPYKIDRLPLDAYNIMVFKDNYVAERFTLNISEARQYTKNVTLRKNTADISISCSLQGAEIYIAGKLVSTAPWRGELSAGTHKIEARKDGHRATVKTITVVRGEAQNISIDAPTPKYGSLNVSANQRDVQVYVDDALLGSAPNIFSNVLEGRHKVVFKKEGFIDNEQWVDVKEGGVFAVRGEMEEKPKYVNQTYTVNGVSFKMIFVEGGTFAMGSEYGEDDEKPAHNVTLSSFFIGEFEVTQELWQAVMGTSISQQRNKVNSSWDLYGVGANSPMYYISYTECEEFCGRLNRLLRYQLPEGFRFCLPTEAQWEYAARGGNQSKGYVYSGSDNIRKVAWYDRNSTHAVGKKYANELGIYDMSGNVWEWCADWYDSSFYQRSPQQDPKNLGSGSGRVLRGGGWYGEAAYCRVAIRYRNSPSIRYNILGFRVACSL